MKKIPLKPLLMVACLSAVSIQAASAATSQVQCPAAKDVRTAVLDDMQGINDRSNPEYDGQWAMSYNNYHFGHPDQIWRVYAGPVKKEDRAQVLSDGNKLLKTITEATSIVPELNDYDRVLTCVYPAKGKKYQRVEVFYIN